MHLWERSVCQVAEDAVRSLLNNFFSRLTDSVLSASPHTHVSVPCRGGSLLYLFVIVSVLLEAWSTVALQVPNNKNNDFPQPAAYTQSGTQLAASATRMYCWFKVNFLSPGSVSESFFPASERPTCLCGEGCAIPGEQGLTHFCCTSYSRLLRFFRMAALLSRVLSTSSNCCHLWAYRGLILSCHCPVLSQVTHSGVKRPPSGCGAAACSPWSLAVQAQQKQHV